MTSLPDKLTDDLMSRHAWLIRMGAVARVLNSQSKREAGLPNKQPAANQ